MKPRDLELQGWNGVGEGGQRNLLSDNEFARTDGPRKRGGLRGTGRGCSFLPQPVPASCGEGRVETGFP